MKLTADYKEMLIESFGEAQFQKIVEAYQMDSVHGLRLNPLKPCTLPFSGTESLINHQILIPDDYAKTVTHPLSHAGCYYIQDPTATTPVTALHVEPHDIVLDLCAAPGGKTTQILSTLTTGFLISNEIDSKRNIKLQHNYDRWGSERGVVTQMDTDDLVHILANTFDKVLLDAPCSGEGLYRRTPDFALEYKKSEALRFSVLQKHLLENAFTACIDGGVIVYSTCTLNFHENEHVILSFLEEHPECQLEVVDLPEKNDGYLGLGNKVSRYFPSKDGEGHFIARIRVSKSNKERHQLKFGKHKPTPFDCFDRTLVGNIKERAGKLYGLRHRGFLEEPLHITRDGVFMGEIKKNRIEYSHTLAQSLNFTDAFEHLELDLESAYRYLYGHPVRTPIQGMHCVTYKGHVLGFVKGDGKKGNNRYPKGLRNNFESY
ncbi:hypothetical protein GTU75_00555 [Erysipelothrix rhusiopathiae]|uniref:RsmF rRNA methyltransferase first C-terminal domain-containing protein n=1 Tax=Erysipelothrix sp. strain 2 (EsS2-7-Brazil) TaxID=2500579 RepID=UPI0013770150|nr:RsmB/NOP family class I SAM-dependent RNA methyltransferase [Erysipelothrix sp. strain 2 (EsS2-7-Brazil)]MBK2403398.1 hypothetical protein [Erysipelothrix sp. strain 2 (EsS2-7-Brazil)]NBA00634.1 hypothetical protein [Erysipelothrix rhusiopathiae]